MSIGLLADGLLIVLLVVALVSVYRLNKRMAELREGRAAFQVSTDERIHHPTQPWRSRLRAIAGRAPRGQANPAWVGSAVNVDDMRAVCAEAGLEIERIADAGTQYTTVHAIRR